MKIVVGLGNPGPEYMHSRHNAGFIFLDELSKKYNISLQFNKKFQANFARTQILQQGQAEDVCLLQPLTFMNRSGESVRAFLDYYYPEFFSEDEGNHLLVAHDDLDLELGQYKLHKGKGPKIHNGLLSIYEQLGHRNFWHVRLGVDSRAGQRVIPPSEYVLMKMSAYEEKLLRQEALAIIGELFT